MTDKDDQEWLDALAGRPDASADPVTNAQAQALRTAMVARRAAIEHATQNADPAEFERLQARLQREGLLTKADADSNTAPRSWLSALLDKWMPAAGGGSSAIPRWSLVANVVLGVAVVVQLGMFTAANNEAYETRGGTDTVMLVPNPEERLAELTTGLDQAKAHYVVLRKPSGELQLLVQADDAALDYLLSQRIEPQVNEGVAVIALRKPGQQSAVSEN
jgi:hypothetical protein